jgi:integrase
MATITIEIGKKNKKRLHPVSFLICEGKTKKRIPTGITATDSELTTNGKRIREPEKAKMIEQKRRELQERLDALQLDALGGATMDATEIAERIVQTKQELDFFAFADDWISKTDVKGKKNYVTMLNSLESYLGKRRLPFKMITYKLLEDYEQHLREKPRAQSLYLGLMRHLFREAMRRYNTDYETVIANDPFQRYRVPKQQMKKGVRALTLEQLMKVVGYEAKPYSRAQLARDCFVLSFCLMGMNSVDMYFAKTMTRGVLKYNRTKTKDRRSDDAYIEVRIHRVIKPLVVKYRGRDRVFSFHQRYGTPEDFNRAINVGLKTVGEAVGIDGLQFYQARHTFATLSRNLMHFSKGDVDEALNHVGTYDIADIYIQKDFSVINENNFKLLHRVFGNPTGEAVGTV